MTGRGPTLWRLAALWVVVTVGVLVGAAISNAATHPPNAVTVIGPGDDEQLTVCRAAVRALQTQVADLRNNRPADPNTGVDLITECLGE